MKKVKVLIIDDSKQILDMLSEFLEMEGYSCSVCNKGKEGLDMILKNKFDVILLDLTIPKFSGQDIINSLSASGKIKEQNIIIFTASSVHNDDIQELLKKGAKFCMKKPFELDSLLSTLEGLGIF